MTEEQMAELRQRFDTIDKRFDVVDQRLQEADKRAGSVDQRFDAIDQRFDAIDKRFDAVDKRFDAVDNRLVAVDQRLDGVDGRLNSLDATVHRQGLLLESNTHELRLAVENFQGLQRVTIAKIDDLRDRVGQRIEPLEMVVRSHSAQLADHTRRLDERGQ